MVSRSLMTIMMLANWVAVAVGGGSATLEIWENLPSTGNSNDDLKLKRLYADPRYPCSPSVRTTTSKLDYKANANHYGTRMTGYLEPPETGDYRLYMASDDEGKFWVSPDEHKGNAVVVANVPGYTGHKQWNKYAEQKSDLIHLESGKRYYFDLECVERAGGDHCTAGWVRPSQPATNIEVIQDHLAPYNKGHAAVLIDDKKLDTIYVDGREILPHHPGTNLLLENVPAAFADSDAHFPPSLPVPSGSKITLRCCGTSHCDFWILTYHCPPCSTDHNGNFPSILEDWDTGSCVPGFEMKGSFVNCQPMTGFRKRLLDGEEETVVPTSEVAYMAVLSSTSFQLPWCKKAAGTGPVVIEHSKGVLGGGRYCRNYCPAGLGQT